MKSPKKVIALDADEILADFLDRFLVFQNSKYNTNYQKKEILSFEIGQIFEVSEEEVEKRMELFYSSGDALNIEVVKGAAKGVDELLKSGYEVHVITARPLMAKDLTLKWLNEHFPDKFKGIHFGFNPYLKASTQPAKAEICHEIGARVLVDDSLVNAASCAKEGITVLLMDAPWNQIETLPKNVIRVKSWEEILEKMDKLWT